MKTVKSVIKSNFSETQLARALCELNCWRTPKLLGLGKRKLTEDEARPFFDILSKIVSARSFKMAWRKMPEGGYKI